MVVLTTDHDGKSLYTCDKGRDTIEMRFAIKVDDTLADISSKNTYFTLKKFRDSTAVIDAAACTNSATTGYTDYIITPAVTAALEYGYYEFEVYHIYTANVREVIYRGRVFVR